MPITPFLDGNTFDPETRRAMGVAFEVGCAALGLADRGDPANGIVAKRIIELARAGERNPDVLCERRRGRTAMRSTRSHARCLR